MSRAVRWMVRSVSLALIIWAGVLAYQALVRFEAERSVLPAGTQIAGIPVGGLDREAAKQRVLQAYSAPVTLRYGDAVIYLPPQEAGFRLDMEAMLPAGTGEQRTDFSWPDFWAFLNGRQPDPWQAGLQASLPEARLRAFLEAQIAPQFDRPATAARLDPMTMRFVPGAPGMALDLDTALPRITAAMLSLTDRQVILTGRELPAGPPDWDDLDNLLRYELRLSGYDAIAGVWVGDLQAGHELSFALQGGSEIPPDVAFTASSIIKIPILVSIFRRLEGEPGPNTQAMLNVLISQSSNDAADWLLKNYLDEIRGPLEMTEDLRTLGLENTFLAGYFALGSPLLDLVQTPANGRADVTTAPDPYSQTTPADIGRLLSWIYACAQHGQGPIIDRFGGEITQTECQRIVEYLQRDNIPYMLKAGLPEGVTLARKHGYAASQGVIQTIGDAGIVSSPGGDFVIAVFLHDSDLLLWDTANAIIGRLAEHVYGFFNFAGEDQEQG